MKISDFGTSQQWSEHSTKMSFVGTVAWMAPEIIRNEPCNEKVDIWSFGVCLWELLNCEVQVPYKNVYNSAIIWGVGSISPGRHGRGGEPSENWMQMGHSSAQHSSRIQLWQDEQGDRKGYIRNVANVINIA